MYFCVIVQVSASEGRRPEEESSFWKISAERSRLEGEQADFQSLTPSQIKSLEKGEKSLPSYLRQVNTDIYQCLPLHGGVFNLNKSCQKCFFTYFGTSLNSFQQTTDWNNFPPKHLSLVLASCVSWNRIQPEAEKAERHLCSLHKCERSRWWIQPVCSQKKKQWCLDCFWTLYFSFLRFLLSCTFVVASFCIVQLHKTPT